MNHGVAESSPRPPDEIRLRVPGSNYLSTHVFFWALFALVGVFMLRNLPLWGAVGLCAAAVGFEFLSIRRLEVRVSRDAIG